MFKILNGIKNALILGYGGPQVLRDSNSLTVKNSEGTDLVPLSTNISATADNHLVSNISLATDTARYYHITFIAESAMPNTSAFPAGYGVVSIEFSGANVGDLLYNNGTDIGDMVIIKPIAGSQIYMSGVEAKNSNINVLWGRTYILDAGLNYVLQPLMAPRACITMPLPSPTNGDTIYSKTKIPVGAAIERVELFTTEEFTLDYFGVVILEITVNSASPNVLNLNMAHVSTYQSDMNIVADHNQPRELRITGIPNLLTGGGTAKIFVVSNE